MSGSRTDIIVCNAPAPAESTMAGVEAPGPETPKKNDKNSTPKVRSTAPLSFKLKLIAEVKKHDIIWQDLKQKKNPDLVEDAWQRIRKVLVIKKAGFCEKQWKLLIHGFRSNLNRGSPMNPDLVREMTFMTSQLKKSSSDEQSESEGVEPASPARNNARTPKTKAARRNGSLSVSEAEVGEELKTSLAILRMLFEKLPPDVMRPVKKSLVETFISLMPEACAKISEHAKQKVKMGGDMNNIDWSTFDVPAEICKAVWDYKVMQVVCDNV